VRRHEEDTCANGKTTVDHGFYGPCGGDNACNKCRCNDGTLFSSKKQCEAQGGETTTKASESTTAPKTGETCEPRGNGGSDMCPAVGCAKVEQEAAAKGCKPAKAVYKIGGSGACCKSNHCAMECPETEPPSTEAPTTVPAKDKRFLQLRLEGRKRSGLSVADTDALKRAVTNHVATHVDITSKQIIGVTLFDGVRRAREAHEAGAASGGVILAKVEVDVEDDAALAVAQKELDASAPADVWDLKFGPASVRVQTTAAAGVDGDVTTVAKGTGANDSKADGKADEEVDEEVDEKLAKELANARQALKEAEERIAQLEAKADAPQDEVEAAQEALETAKRGVTAAAAAVAASAGEDKGTPTEDTQAEGGDGDDSLTTVVVVVVVLVLALAVIAAVMVAVRTKSDSGGNDGMRQQTFENPTYAQPDSFAAEAEHVSAVDYRDQDFNKGPRNRMDSVC